MSGDYLMASEMDETIIETKGKGRQTFHLIDNIKINTSSQKITEKMFGKPEKVEGQTMLTSRQ